MQYLIFTTIIQYVAATISIIEADQNLPLKKE